MRTPRLYAALLIVGLVASGLWLTARASDAARPGADGATYVALLPMTWRGAAVSELPLPATAVAPGRVVTGTVVLAGGRSIVGGTVGQTIKVPADFTAHSSAGPVTQMRVAESYTCRQLPADLSGPWEPFTAHREFEEYISVANFVVLYVQAQFRDVQGNTSPVVCDDVSMEGMPGPTETAMATAEPTAVATPSPEPGGKISGRLLVNGTPAAEGTGQIGPALWLRRCSGPDCVILARAGVLGDQGMYTFEHVPALPPDAYYQVAWQNEDNGDLFGDETLLGSWYGSRITSFVGTDDVTITDIELADVALVSPTHGTGFQGLPITFKWQVRPGDETYRWGIVRGCGLQATRQQALLTESLGHNGQYDLTRYPPGVEFGNDHVYCWFVRVVTTAGYGESYYARMMWFIQSLLNVP
jgi:hypothetical protein